MGSNDTNEKGVKKLTVPVNIGADHIRGSVNASITLVEYGNYECPYTAMAYPIGKEIMRQSGDKMHFVFRNFPLNDIHPHAQAAAEAAEALLLKTNSGRCMTIYLNIKRH
jgi:protein-disulfide isomerase